LIDWLIDCCCCWLESTLFIVSLIHILLSKRSIQYGLNDWWRSIILVLSIPFYLLFHIWNNNDEVELLLWVLSSLFLDVLVRSDYFIIFGISFIYWLESESIGYSPYAPTKYAVRGLLDCLDSEYQPFNINFQLAIPADVDTPMFVEVVSRSES
jgi:NAD(P)-dependent dehydrogenase (short-subunit alcohol dehydrogenase family)